MNFNEEEIIMFKSFFLKKVVSCLFCVLLLTVFSPRALYAQVRIQEVAVSGNQSIDSETILAQVLQIKGQSFSPQQVSEDIQRIYELGYFDDVQAEKISSGKGVKLIYHVKEKPPIQKVVIKGNKKIKTEKILSEISVKANSLPDNQKIAESKQKIKSLYDQEGYNDALIIAEVKEVNGQQQLEFNISEKKGNVVREINFEGNKVISDRQLHKAIQTKEKGFLSFITGSGKLREDALERDVALINYTYLNKGYMRVRVGQPKIEPVKGKKEGVALTFYIDEGEQYKIGNITFSGDVLTSTEEMQKLMESKTGEVYSQQTLERDLNRLANLYGNQGYAYANIVPQSALNDGDLTTDLNIVVDKGNRVYVERINITGNTITRDKVIRRELKIVENSLYNRELLEISRAKLMQLGYFESVDFATPTGSKDDRIVLNINVKEKPTGTFSVGGGFSSAESFMFTASIAKNNFFGRGISGALNAEISGRRQEFSARFTDPYFLDSRWILSASGYRIRTDFPDYRRNAFGGSLDFGRRIFDNTTISLGYRIEDVSLDDFDLNVPEFFRQNADGLTSSAVFSIRRDTRNNPLVTTRGSYFSFTTEYAGNGLGGDNDYLRLEGNARYYYPVWKTSVLRFNARAGYIKSLNDEPVPLFERYFTGGVNSLRGFELRTVGPRLTIPDTITGKDEEFIYGGNKLLVFNLEYEFPIYDQAGFRGVVFFDAGNAFAEDEVINPIKLRTDVGAGIRWNSPFGPLRFEWGFPLKKRAGEKRSVFNFTIGSFF